MQAMLSFMRQICFSPTYNIIPINKIYDFLEIPKYNHNLKSLNQFKVNGIGYDDKVVGNRMHTIREEIRKESNPYRAMIPESIVRAYGHIVL